VFGSKNEQVWLDDLIKVAGDRDDIINLIGQIQLEDLPHAISKMDCYIASDSGNIYIADAVGVPIILIYGPCCVKEQRPLGNVLLIGDDANTNSFVFETRYYFDKPKEELFGLSDDDLNKIRKFVSTYLNQIASQDIH
jgi:hypothetical protein